MTTIEARKIIGDILKNRKKENLSPVEQAMRLLCEAEEDAADTDPDLWKAQGVRYAAKVADKEDVKHVRRELEGIFEIDVLAEGKELRVVVQVVR